MKTLLVFLLLAAPVFAQDTHLVGVFDVRLGVNSGYRNPTLGAGLAGGLRHKFVYLGADAVWLRAVKDYVGDGHALEGRLFLQIEPPTMRVWRPMLGGGLVITKQVTSQYIKTGVSPFAFAGWNFDNEIVIRLGYQFSDNTQNRLRAIIFNLDYFNTENRHFVFVYMPQFEVFWYEQSGKTRRGFIFKQKLGIGKKFLIFH